MARRSWQRFTGAFAAAALGLGALTSCSGGTNVAVAVDGSTGSPDATHPGADGSRADGPHAHEGGTVTGPDASHPKDGSPTIDTGCDGFCGTGGGCTKGADCASGVCKGSMCAAPSATDGVKNDSETDVDCGGGTLANGMPNPASDGAPACANGQACVVGSDCSSASCQMGKCVAPTCTDMIKDGMETDVDCGGPSCNPCPAMDKCDVAKDCQSDVCTGGVCQAPTDSDGVKNDSETDVDCGGALLADGSANPTSDGAPVCATGKACLVGADCAQGVCATGTPGADGGAAGGDGGASALTCQPASPTDGVKNDSETDVDCGGALLAGGATNPMSDGAPACGAGKKCAITLDCTSLVCTNDVCEAPTATDGVKNDSETDIDCGGALLASGQANPASDGAPACADGKSCVLGTDCKDLVCAAGPIAAGQGSTNGSPINCPAGKTCTCQAPSPTDGVDNDSETDVDCGGDLLATGAKNTASDGAPVCAVGKKCKLGTDCAQAVCNSTGGGAGPANCAAAGDPCVCQPASPTDGVQNDSETDVDCGGALLASGQPNPASDKAPTCAVGKKCLLGSDCTIGICNANVGAGPFMPPIAINCPAGKSCTCQAPADNDGLKNDSETDVDCGGALLANGQPNGASDGAPGCADGLVCALDSDCLSGFCSTLSHTCVAGQSCVGLITPAKILTITGTNANGDGVGTPNANGTGQHAGIDTCGKGESTDPVAKQVHESCCKSLVIPAAVLPAADAAGTRLDKYEVTAGRMRQFIESANQATIAAGNEPYDLYHWMSAQFAADLTTPVTNVGKLFAAQVPAGTTVKALIQLLPTTYYVGTTLTGNAAPDGKPADSIVAALGGTTMDPNYPSNEQGCYVYDGANGATTYWWPALTNSNANPVVVGGDQVGDGPRPFTQDYYDIKSMNCGTYWIYAAFCAWDGGHVATLAELDAVYGKLQYPWAATPLPTNYTYTTSAGLNHQNFVPGTPFYNAAEGNVGLNAVDITMNWNNNSFNNDTGNFYFYPNGGTGPTDMTATILSGLDYSPYIAAPGRFYLDKTAILSASGDGWQDLGANMLEMTSTATGGSTVFCDCSTGGTTVSAACPNKCPNTNVYGIPREGGVGFPSIRWEGGSWEGHETANPASPPFFSSVAYSEPLQTQYGKAGFRCARAPE